MTPKLKNLTLAITLALGVGTITACANTSSSMSADSAKAEAESSAASNGKADNKVTISGTTTPFASEAIYFVMNDRFVDGDPSNNHEDQGGEFPTWQLPMEGPDLSDIHIGDWVDRWLPAAWRPYARLARIDRPVGIWLTFFPCLAALIQASQGLPEFRLLVVFFLGAFLMRSAGSTANDIADRNFDGHVERTRLRPLASGQLRTRHALIFLAVELALAALLLFFLSPFTALVSVCVLPLVFIYPLCKRFTHWPQAVLGAAFNWGMLMAWAEVSGNIPAGAVVMWLGAIAWQIGYDTVYAYVDVADDTRLGLKSTAVLFVRMGQANVGWLYSLTVGASAVGG